MQIPELAPALIARIQSAPPDVTNQQLAAELGVHRHTVRKYRVKARQRREEAAREIIALHVETNIGDALADLIDLRRLARERYEEAGDPRQGNLWLAAVKTTLEHVKPDDAALDAAIDAELAALHEQRQGSLLQPAPAASVH